MSFPQTPQTNLDYHQKQEIIDYHLQDNKESLRSSKYIY